MPGTTVATYATTEQAKRAALAAQTARQAATTGRFARVALCPTCGLIPGLHTGIGCPLTVRTLHAR